MEESRHIEQQQPQMSSSDDFEIPEPFVLGMAMRDESPDIFTDPEERPKMTIELEKEHQQRMVSPVDDVDYTLQTDAPKEKRCCPIWFVNAADRIFGILEVPVILVFGIFLYLVDVGSDIAAAVSYYQEGHLVWGSLTVIFVAFPCICSAAFSWTYWYYDNKKDRHPGYRSKRLIFSVLLLDPLVRQIRLLWFTLMREYRKCGDRDSVDVSSEAERKRRQKDTNYPDYWQKRVDAEECTAAFLTAIATLIEDASEITLALYVIVGHGEQESVIGYIQLITSLLSIFYTTAQFPQQVRLLEQEKDQIKFFSMATAALLIWRTFIVGSRILIFVLFASLFRHWLFVVVGLHYLLMFALVFYQMRLSDKKLIRRVLYILVTPFVYIFDFCVNWLNGPSRYWYVMCYVLMFCENILMSGLVLWYVRTMPSPAWFIVPGSVSVMVMFPLGVLSQMAYYRYWHPNVRRHGERSVPENSDKMNNTHPPPTQIRLLSWSEFRDKVIEQNRLLDTLTNTEA